MSTELLSFKKHFRITLDLIEKTKQGCKPGYVENGHLSRTAVANRLKQPTLSWRATSMLKSGLASNGVYRAISVTRDAVVSYTAFPPLPVTWRYISVALSLELPPPDVIRHPALRSPDFPRLYVFRQCSRDHSPYLVLCSLIIW